jgi:serine/threonine protein kinase
MTLNLTNFPACISLGHLTTKSDVFSFGVVLLEMLSGRRAVDKNRPNGEHNMVEWARPYLTSKRRIFRILDARLGGQYSLARAQKAASLALQCLSVDPRHRPTMEQVVTVLEQLHDTKEEGNIPRPQLQKKLSSNRSLSGSRSSSVKGNNKPTPPRPA